MEKTELSREILHIFSDSIRKRIEGILCRPDLTEIRLRVNPDSLNLGGQVHGNII